VEGVPGTHCHADAWPYVIKSPGSGAVGSLPPGSLPPGSDAKFELDNPGAFVGDLMETIGQGCWLCNIFALSYDISVVLTERVFDKIGSGMASLIAVALGIWVLFQAAKLLTPFGPMSGPTGVANIIFIRLGIALLVMTMLRLGFGAYNDMIQAPIMGAGIELSQELLNTASNTLGSLGSVWKKPDCEDSFIPTPYISAAATYYNNHPEANITRRNFICLPRQMQDTLGSGMAFGVSNIMASGNLAEISGEAVVKAFDRFFSGVVLVAVYFIAIIIFGMFLLDMLFRFIMTGVMSPIWLAAAVFPSTRFAFSQGVRQLARCALTLVLMTVLIVIAAGLIGISTQKALSDGQATLKPEQKTAVNACLAKGAAAAAYCKSNGTADKDCDMSYGSGKVPATGGPPPSSLITPATSGIGGVPSSPAPAPGGGTVPKPTPVPIPSSPGSLAAPASFNMPDVYDDSLQSAVYNTPTLSPMMTIPAVFTTTDSAVPASLFTTVAASGTATPTATPAPTPTPAPVGQCPSVNIGSGGGVGAGMGGSVSAPPANTQPWGGSTDPEAIMFSCMMNVGGFTIGFGNPAFYQMLAGVLVVLLYMSRVYNLAAMYVGVRQSSGSTLGQLMAGLTMKGFGILGGAAAGAAGAGASMAIAGGAGLLGKAIGKASKAPRDRLSNMASDAGTAIGNAAQQAQESLSRQAAPVVDPFVSAASSKWENLSDSVSNRVESGRNYLGGIVGAGIAAATPAIKTLEQSAEGLKNWAGDVTQPARDFADKAKEAAGQTIGGGLNDLDNLFESVKDFWDGLGKMPANAALSVLAPVILMTNNAMGKLSPAQLAALHKATGAAGQVGRVVGNLAQGAIGGAAWGAQIDNELIGSENFNLNLGETSIEDRRKKLAKTREKQEEKYVKAKAEMAALLLAKKELIKSKKEGDGGEDSTYEQRMEMLETKIAITKNTLQNADRAVAETYREVETLENQFDRERGIRKDPPKTAKTEVQKKTQQLIATRYELRTNEGKVGELKAKVDNNTANPREKRELERYKDKVRDEKAKVQSLEQTIAELKAKEPPTT
jgi:hypothetical protein